MSWKALPVLLVTVAVAAAACDGADGTTELSLVCPSKGTPQPPPDLASLSLEDVYERMAESITCPGYAMRVFSVGTDEMGSPDEEPFVLGVRRTDWIDLPAQRARYETRSRLQSTPSTQGGGTLEDEEVREVAIVLHDATYWGEINRGPPEVSHPIICHESESAILSLLLGCAGYTEDSVTRFQADVEYEGRRLPALITEGDVHWSDGPAAFTQTLYLDQVTLLPLSGASQRTEDDGDSETSQVSHRYDFVPLDSLPEDFFEPAAIGYVGADLEEELRGVDLGIGVYWLGVEFPGGEGLPPLSLERAYPLSPPPNWLLPEYEAMVEYRLAADKFASGAVDLELYPRAEWDAYLDESGRVHLSAPCGQEAELHLADRRAEIISDYDVGQLPAGGCPQRPPDLWVAYVHMDDTVVLVRTPGHWAPGVGHIRSPYASREGMEAIIGGLVPRPPDQ